MELEGCIKLDLPTSEFSEFGKDYDVYCRNGTLYVFYNNSKYEKLFPLSAEDIAGLEFSIGREKWLNAANKVAEQLLLPSQLVLLLLGLKKVE